MHVLGFSAGIALAVTEAVTAQKVEAPEGALACGVIVAVGLGLLLAVLLISSFWLWLAARMTKLSGTFGTAVGATILIWIFLVLFNLTVRLEMDAAGGTRGLLLNLAAIPVAALAVKFGYSTSYPRAFLAYLVSYVISLISIVVTVVALVLAVEAVSGDNELTAALRRGWAEITSKELVTFSSEAPAPGGEEAVSTPLADAGAFVGSKVRVVLTDGGVVSGTLKEVGSDTLVIRQNIGGGSMELPVRKSQIRDFQLLVRRSEAP